MTPMGNRMLAWSMAMEPPPETPDDFTATHLSGDCPALNVKLEWDNAGREESKVLEFSQDGSTGWTQIATPGVADEEYVHEGVDPGVNEVGYWRIRWDSEATWANASALVSCPE